MTAPRIIDINIGATTAKYPQRISVAVTWDQAIFEYSVTNLVFEANTGIPLMGYNGGQGTVNPPNPIGQTLVKSYRMLSPYISEFSFQVSPWAAGTLQISNQPWNLPVSLVAKNAAGVNGDWSPLLAPNVFSSITLEPYFAYYNQDGTPSVSTTDTYLGFPKVKKDRTYQFPTTSPLPYPVQTIVVSTDGSVVDQPIPTSFWEGGSFYLWSSATSVSLFSDTSPSGKFYSTTDITTTRGPQAYLLGGFIGWEVRSTFIIPPPFDPYKNQYGSIMPKNFNNGEEAQRKDVYSPINWFGVYSTYKNGSALGRWDTWICANPYKDDPVPRIPASWGGQAPSSVNNFCIAPWRLAKPQDSFPLLIQVYIPYTWIWSSASPAPA
jgi:hypothetical protein